MIASSKIDAAKRLARLHFEVEPDLKHIFLLGPIKEDDPREPIKLLEVVEGAVERGIEPIAFSSNPARGIDFPSVIVELSSREFADLGSAQIVFQGETWKIETEFTASA